MGDQVAHPLPHDAVVWVRSTLTLLEGLGSRIHQTLSPRGAARSHRWRVAAALSGVVDVAKAKYLTRDSRFGLIPRLALDAADLSLWCMAARDDTDTSEDAVIPGVALAAEAGARLGPGGFIVPAVNAGVAAGIRYRRGHRLRLEQFSWQVMGVAGGWMLSVFARRRRNALELEHDQELRARLQGAELAGLHDVVMTNEGAIDVLQRATALIDLGGVTARRRDFAGAFKADVADAVRSRATYLRDALVVWQARRNLHPELSRAVMIDLPSDDGTILLSAEQVAQLHDALDALALAGRVRVESVDRVEAARPYGNRDLDIDGTMVALPASVSERAWTFDAIPTAFLMNVGWLLQPMGAHREAVPWKATALPLAMGVGATVWSARRADRDGVASPHIALTVSFVGTLTYTVAASRTMRHPHADGSISRFPWTLPLQGYELVRSIAVPHLGLSERRVAALGTAVIVAVGWALAPAPRSVRALVAELQWCAATVVGARQLRDAIREQADGVTRAIAADDQRLTLLAYQAGRARAHATIAAAVAEARRALDAGAAQLDVELRAEAHRRLLAVDALLTQT